MRPDETVSFRVVCRVKIAGEIIDSVRSQTQTNIHIQQQSPPSCSVITISGEARVGTTASILSETVPVSPPQKALLLLFEGMHLLQGSPPSGECCLLAPPGKQMGLLIGKAGCSVKAIQRDTRADIRAHKPDSGGDQLIHISGDPSAVKKALVAVSSRLQPALSSAGCEVPNRRRVSFRLLCPYDTAGGVIGKNADIIKAMEKETGTSIRFSAPLDTSRERVATIVSIEKPDPLYSPSQVAVNLVFTRSIEVKGMDRTRSVEARLLVGPGEIDCLIDDAGRISEQIKLSSGIEIQLLGPDFAPTCAQDDDIVVQLTGGFAQVKETLYRITGRLRESLFSKKILDKEGWWQHPHSSTTSNNRDGRRIVSSVLAEPPMKDSPGGKKSLGFNNKFSVLPPRLPHEMFKTYAKAVVESDHYISEVKQKSIDTETSETVSVEMAVPEQAFSNVYGENGINLARLKEISGATVIVQNPRPGKSGGKVVTSGTMTQVQIAQSLLHAFILLQ